MPPKRKKATRISAERALGTSGDSDEVLSVGSSVADSLCDVTEDEIESKPSESIEVDTGDELEMKIAEEIENISDKNARIRGSGLISLKNILSKRVLSEFLHTRKETFSDALEKCLKKGRPDDRIMSASVAALLCIQLGSGPEVEYLFSNIQSLLVAIVQDSTLKSQMRATCTNALGLLTFISADDLRAVYDVMDLMEKLFTAKQIHFDILVEAVSTWCLLLSITPTDKERIKKVLPLIVKLLQSTDVGLRIAAGECLAMLYESKPDETEDSEKELFGEKEEEMIETLQQLATDGSKHRSKKDRKQQRSSFRDVLRTIEDGDSIYETHRFGVEILEIDSWARRRQFFAFKDLLGSGINIHLKENEMLRDVFRLGRPLISPVISKEERREQRHYNAVCAKARRIDRQKHRDKRTS